MGNVTFDSPYVKYDFFPTIFLVVLHNYFDRSPFLHCHVTINWLMLYLYLMLSTMLEYQHRLYRNDLNVNLSMYNFHQCCHLTRFHQFQLFHPFRFFSLFLLFPLFSWLAVTLWLKLLHQHSLHHIHPCLRLLKRCLFLIRWTFQFPKIYRVYLNRH